MFDVNDDMDELFRRAAENYPLKTDTSDWQKVEQKLAAAEPDESVKGGSKNKSWFLLLLLLPVAWICNNHSHKSDKAAAKIENPSTKNIQPDHENDKNNDKSITYKQDNSSAEKLAKKQVNQGVKYKESHTRNNKLLPNLLPRKSTLSTRESTLNIKSKKKYSGNSVSSNPMASAELTNDLTKDLTVNSTRKENKAFSTEQDESDPNRNLQTDADAGLKVAGKDTSNNTVVSENANPITNDSAGKNAKTKDRKKTLRLYAGIVGSADISTVKFQSTKTPGLGAGILAGYQLTKRLSVESGLSYQKKFYFTDAKYYNPKKVYTSPSRKLLYVEGNCSMLELPINLKYNFKTSAKHSWFVVSGLSSYFIKAEDYDYTYEGNGQLTYWHMNYKNSSSSLATVINANIGYERKAGKTGTLRIEPYLKLPVKGYGWGRMPIMSTGLNVGYTKKIF